MQEHPSLFEVRMRMAGRLSSPTISEVKTPKGKVNDSRILLFYERVLGEPFKMKDDVWWKSLAFEPSQLAGRFLLGWTDMSDQNGETGYRC